MIGSCPVIVYGFAENSGHNEGFIDPNKLEKRYNGAIGVYKRSDRDVELEWKRVESLPKKERGGEVFPHIYGIKTTLRRDGTVEPVSKAALAELRRFQKEYSALHQLPELKLEFLLGIDYGTEWPEFLGVDYHGTYWFTDFIGYKDFDKTEAPAVDANTDAGATPASDAAPVATGTGKGRGKGKRN